MPKWSIRDFWGKRTEKKALNADMRTMLMSLDGVYEPKGAVEPDPAAEGEEQTEDARQAS